MKPAKGMVWLCGRRGFCAALCALAAALCLHPAYAQERPAGVKALLVSDVHFEPFWDTGKVVKLAAAPVKDWPTILSLAPSANRAARFSALTQSCHMRGEDTSYPLLASAMEAMNAQASGARFVAVSGDLVAHKFDCKFHALFPLAKPGEYRAFVAKTMDFVITEIRKAAGDKPVYVALGNNDSDCGDYELDANGAFLADMADAISGNAPESERAQVAKTFKEGGYYSVMLQPPIENTRLVVLNDIFLSSSHTDCSGKADPAPGNRELQWLSAQLAEARAAHENVWVMGHIPPGVNAYSTLVHTMLDCSAKPPTMFLASDKLGEELADAGDEIRLAIFAHAHTDEIKLLEPRTADTPAKVAEPAEESAKGKSVAVKMVPSISPVNGNNPSFVVAQVNPTNAELMDYQVYATADTSGAGEWRELYDFDRAYGADAFTAQSVHNLLMEFADDPDGKSKASQTYIGDFLTGRPDVLLPMVWPRYVCTLLHSTASGYTSCACPASGQGAAEVR